MTRDDELAQVEAVLGYSFKHRALLDQALTHASVGPENNDALATLGDRIYNVWVARRVWETTPSPNKGLLTNRINDHIDRYAQSEVFFGLDLDDHLLMGGAVHGVGGEVKPSMASTAIEALTAAVELDGGRDEAEAMLERLLGGAFA